MNQSPMIQKNGTIRLESVSQVDAAIEKLKNKGFKSLGLKNAPPCFLSWEEEQFFTHNFEDTCYAIHTLADFNLDENGNELPTFCNLKPGDPNPFTVGMEVRFNGRDGVVQEVDNNPSIMVEWESGDAGWYGFSHQLGIEYDIISINEIFPIEAPVQSETRETLKAVKPAYKFGDKVKTFGHEPKPRYYIGEAGNVAYTSDIDPAFGYGFSARGTSPMNISPWRAPITINAGIDYEVKITPENVTVGCQEITPDNAVRVAEAILKMYKA